MFRTTKAYLGSDYPECIALQENDVVYDVTKLDKFWYRGTQARTGDTGTFPVSCVEAVGGTGENITVIEREHGKKKTSASNISNTRKDRSDAKGPQDQLDVEINVDACRTNKNLVNSKISPKKREQVTTKVNGTRLKGNPSMCCIATLLKSDSSQHRCLKAVAGIIAGVVAGAIMFILLTYSFDYTTLEASVITIVFTIVVSVCLAASTFFRCIMALVIPNFLLGEGRAVILTIIFALMLSNPVTNIANNAKETGNSMACASEMVVNQSRELKENLAVPIRKLISYVKDQQNNIDEILKGFREFISELESILDDVKEGIESVEAAIEDVIQKCEVPLREIKDWCSSTCGDIGSVGEFFGADTKEMCGFCNTEDINCGQLRELFRATGVMDIAKQSKEFINQVKEFFNAEVIVSNHFDASAESSNSIDSIRKDIDRDISSKVRTFKYYIGVTKKIVSISLVLVFLQAFLYLRSYLAKDAYDNMYITQEFTKLDKTSTNPVLPLKKKENGVYVMTTSFTLSSSELTYCKGGVFQVLLHFILCSIVIIFDYALYYILSQVGKFSKVSVSAGGHTKNVVEVTGTGPIAAFYKGLLGGLDIDESFSSTVNMETCLPKPSVPSASTFPVFASLYLVALVFVFLRGYGMRLRRLFAAYFYPEQERERLKYLNEKIRHKRVGFLRQQIKSARKESRARFSTWLMFKCPCLARCIPKKSQQECTSCEQKDSRSSLIKMTPCNGVTDGMPCEAIYCEECWTALHNECPVCSKDEEDMRNI